MRILVYVNENPTEKHITIHCERKGPCNCVFQNLASGRTQMTSTLIDLSNGNKTAIKIAETENSYWILLWIDKDKNPQQNNIIKQIAKNLGVQINNCKHCC